MGIGKKLIAISLLGGIGLNRRRRFAALAISAIGMVAFGAALGASMGLAFAPSSGRKLRADVSDKFGQLRERVRREQKIEGQTEQREAEARANATP
jgi:hypothetical protein